MGERAGVASSLPAFPWAKAADRPPGTRLAMARCRVKGVAVTVRWVRGDSRRRRSVDAKVRTDEANPRPGPV